MNVCWTSIVVDLSLQLSSTACDLVHNDPMLVTDDLVFLGIMVLELLDHLHVLVCFLRVREA